MRCKKTFPLCLASRISHMYHRWSTILNFRSYETQFRSFSIIPTNFKRCETLCHFSPDLSASSSCVWFGSSSNNASISASSYTYSLPQRSMTLPYVIEAPKIQISLLVPAKCAYSAQSQILAGVPFVKQRRVICIDVSMKTVLFIGTNIPWNRYSFC